MSKLPKSSTPLIALGLGLAVAFILLVIVPLNRSITAAENSLQLKQSLVSQEQSLQNQLAKYEAETAELEDYTKAFAEVPNVNLHLSQLLGQVSKQAKEAGAQSLRLEPGQVKQMRSLQCIPVQLGCQGTFQEIHDLIRRLEKLPNEIWIERVELAPTSEGDRLLSCELEFEAFMVSVKNSH